MYESYICSYVLGFWQELLRLLADRIGFSESHSSAFLDCEELLKEGISGRSVRSLLLLTHLDHRDDGRCDWQAASVLIFLALRTPRLGARLALCS